MANKPKFGPNSVWGSISKAVKKSKGGKKKGGGKKGGKGGGS
jgi:hypothetical protein